MVNFHFSKPLEITFKFFDIILLQGYTTASVDDSKKSMPKFTRHRFYKLFKWMTVGFAVGSGTIYLYNLFVPDWRELQDKKHYYSDWKVSHSFVGDFNFHRCGSLLQFYASLIHFITK